MNEKCLVINCGSSSVKFQLFEIPDGANALQNAMVIAKGNVERIGKDDCSWLIKAGDIKIKNSRHLASHVEAVNVILNELLNNHVINDVSEIKAVGHRVLHGGDIYNDSVIIDEKVLDDIIKLTVLGPLHHPGEVAGIKCMMTLLPEATNVAVFDTAYHQTIPKRNYLYPVPYEWYQKYGVRKYGFHGTSVKYITEYMKKRLGINDINLIVCHIGSGASITAIKNGQSYDTSMGLTPLDGLMMGTRSGSVDPSIIEYVKRLSGKTTAELNRELNEHSGLFGVAGKNDYRDIEKGALAGDKRSQEALDMFIASVVKYISQYYTELDGQIDGIVFTAGIGENSANFRKLVTDELRRPLGIVIDSTENEEIAGFKDKHEGLISDDYSKYKVFVVPTDEEKMIMLDTYRLVKEQEKGKKR